MLRCTRLVVSPVSPLSSSRPTCVEDRSSPLKSVAIVPFSLIPYVGVIALFIYNPSSCSQAERRLGAHCTTRCGEPTQLRVREGSRQLPLQCVIPDASDCAWQLLKEMASGPNLNPALPKSPRTRRLVPRVNQTVGNRSRTGKIDGPELGRRVPPWHVELGGCTGWHTQAPRQFRSLRKPHLKPTDPTPHPSSSSIPFPPRPPSVFLSLAASPPSAAMAKQRLLALLLLAALLALSFSQGTRPVPCLSLCCSNSSHAGMVEARKVRVMRAVRHDGRHPPALRGRLLPEEMVYTLMDYNPPSANTNTHGGMYPSPDTPSPPSH
ncbi:hypothetical protein HU200_037483 [Digitaria exilis]|uniref:Uncharacterized protein n=1 Tax=Digitaria exilis TaxID=1010633 RepID=A0A835BEF3_9POAL|nr:hypothetical protein HU200_037483 [Digitaria exilis]